LLLLCLMPPPAQARTLGQVLDRKIFTICADPNAQPYSIKNDKPSGLQIDLARAIAQELGVGFDVQWILFRRDARQVGCDAVMGSIVPKGSDEVRSATSAANDEGVKLIRSAVTHAYARQTTRVALARAVAARVTSLDDLRHLTVAVPHASVAHQVLYEAGVPVQTRYQSESEILDAVVAGNIEAGLVNDWVYGWYVKTHPTADLTQLTTLVVDPQLDFDVGITLRNTDPALLSRVNGILDRLANVGVLARIFAEYGIVYPPPHAR
jgi:polar amino acid transport system substrate-binding protein